MFDYNQNKNYRNPLCILNHCLSKISETALFYLDINIYLQILGVPFFFIARKDKVFIINVIFKINDGILFSKKKQRL
ncbi:hypothetical protein DRF69_00010 [Chryseobacterium sp. 5_R23647]|nr:hypothetical protein DRF69_00010 [Chryseobacterium sp. 5_R23647]